MGESKLDLDRKAMMDSVSFRDETAPLYLARKGFRLFSQREDGSIQNLVNVLQLKSVASFIGVSLTCDKDIETLLR